MATLQQQRRLPLIPDCLLKLNREMLDGGCVGDQSWKAILDHLLKQKTKKGLNQILHNLLLRHNLIARLPYSTKTKTTSYGKQALKFLLACRAIRQSVAGHIHDYQIEMTDNWMNICGD